MGTFLILHDITGDIIGINADCVEAVGILQNKSTFVMPKVGGEDSAYLVTETVEEVLGLLQELGCQMIGLKEGE